MRRQCVYKNEWTSVINIRLTGSKSRRYLDTGVAFSFLLFSFLCKNGRIPLYMGRDNDRMGIPREKIIQTDDTECTNP